MAGALATVPQSAGAGHPAARAWRMLGARGRDPRSVAYLGGTPTASSVYRLTGAGRAGAAVIAKQGPSRELATEWTIYEEVLPGLGVPALRCHGFLEHDGEGSSWLFLEDAGDASCLPSVYEHRLLAACWLGVLHSSAADHALDRVLPARGSAYHRACLDEARAALAQQLPERRPEALHGLVVERIVGHLAELDRRWPELEALCSWIAPTLAHGDLAPRNMRVRSVAGRPVLLVFDWEIAGWGPPVADLRRFAPLSASPEARAYLRLVRRTNPELDERRLRVLSEVGIVLRAVDSMYWASTRFENGGLVWEGANLDIYDRRLARAMTWLGWSDDRRARGWLPSSPGDRDRPRPQLSGLLGHRRLPRGVEHPAGAGAPGAAGQSGVRPGAGGRRGRRQR